MLNYFTDGGTATTYHTFIVSLHNRLNSPFPSKTHCSRRSRSTYRNVIVYLLHLSKTMLCNPAFRKPTNELCRLDIE